jgi:hypothetical protein
LLFILLHSSPSPRVPVRTVSFVNDEKAKELLWGGKRR